MNRRGFLKAAAGAVAAAFVVPEIIVPERRVWALDSTMIRPQTGYNLNHFHVFQEEMLRQRMLLDHAMMTGEYQPLMRGGLNQYITGPPKPGASMLTPGDLDSIMEEVWDSLG